MRTSPCPPSRPATAATRVRSRPRSPAISSPAGGGPGVRWPPPRSAPPPTPVRGPPSPCHAADADRPPLAPDAPAGPGPGDEASGHHARTAPEAGHTPPQAHPVAQADGTSGRGVSGQGFPAAPEAPHAPDPYGNGGLPQAPGPAPDNASWGNPTHTDAAHPGTAHPDTGHTETEHADTGHTAHTTGVAAVADPVPHPADAPDARRQPLPAEEPMPDGGNSDSTQGRAFSVRTLGQGVPFAQHLAHQQNQPHQSLGGAGRRRKLAAPPEGDRTPARTMRRPAGRTPAGPPGPGPADEPRTRARTGTRPAAATAPEPGPEAGPGPGPQPGARGRTTGSAGRRAGPAPPTARGSCSRRPSRRGARTP